MGRLGPTVEELMHRRLVTCPHNTLLRDVADVMSYRDVRSLVVVNDSGVPVGVVHDTDLLAGHWAGAPDDVVLYHSSQYAESVMSRYVTIDVTAPAFIAVERMIDERSHRLLATERGRPVGVLSVSDLVRWHARRMPQERRTVADVMCHGVVTVRPDTSIRRAAQVMLRRQTTYLVVAGTDGRCRGVLDGFDLARLFLHGRSAEVVADLVQEPFTIRPHAYLRQAAERLVRRRVDRLLVVDPKDPEGLPLGVVTATDVATVLRGDDSREAEFWDEYVVVPNPLY